MICQACSHNFPNTLTRCPRCKALSNRRSAHSSDARLIEFPRKTRTTPYTESSEIAVPAWRQELNEKVRAIRARRDSESPSASNISAERGEERLDATDLPGWRSRDAVPQEASVGAGRARVAPLESLPRDWSHPGPDDSAIEKSNGKTVNPIIEKALSRVRRASENARREYLPKIEPAKPPRPSYSFENQATARALESTPEPASLSPAMPASLRDVAASPIESRTKRTLDIAVSRTAAVAVPAATEKPAPAVAPTEASTVAPTPSISTASPVHRPEGATTSAAVRMTPAPEIALNEAVDALAIDELEPLDYLEAEMRKVDRALTAELRRDDVPAVITHAVITAIDLVTIAVCSLPFLALASVYAGDLGAAHTRTGAYAIVMLISFFYLALTQSLCGRTFGMMFTGTRVIDVLTAQPPSAARAVLRTAGYFIAAAPFMIGILWAAASSQGRGWQDYLAGTRVVTDF